MIIDICFACDENYALYVGCVLQSLLDVKGEEEYRVWVISDEITTKTKEWLKKTCSSFDINFVEIPLDFLVTVPLKNKHLSRATYARLAVGSVLPNDVARVIYLDCDILILKSLKNLWEFDLKDNVLAGVEDWGILFNEKQKSNWPFNSSYKTAGVLLIDLQKWRKAGCEEKCLAYLRHPKFPLLYEDQDVLNFSLHSVFGEIPPEWDVVLYFSEDQIKNKDFPNRWREALKNPYLVHYASPDKPWSEGCLQPYQENFKKYMEKLKIPFKKIPRKEKLRLFIKYWWRHPVCFLKRKFWTRLSKYKWGAFR